MYAIVDVNNFYASVEKTFNPKLKSKPVVVLSNNDGCVIARSAEAKSLGIKMGQPAYLSKKFFKNNDVTIFSSNYTLYADMSQRVMSILAGFVPEIEMYSIDEAFLNLSSLNNFDLDKFGIAVRQKIYQWTGLIVSVGIAPTKTLAKVANKLIKKNQIKSGVLLLQSNNAIDDVLDKFDISDVWGIGKQHANFLKQNNIDTAYQFKNANEDWIHKNLTVVGRRTQMELQQFPCIGLDDAPAAKKGIGTTRCFGKDVYAIEEISEALCHYVSRACEKLRKNNLHAGKFTVILHTNVFRQDISQYYNKSQKKLPVYTNNTNEVLPYAISALHTLFKKGICYYKTGIIFGDLKPDNEFQSTIFDTYKRDKRNGLMKTLDGLNQNFGKGTIVFGAEGLDKSFVEKIYDQFRSCD